MAVTLAAHADWSLDARKRWLCVARRAGDGWRLEAPEPVGALGALLPRLRAAACGGAVALGLDLPLGVPRAYAARWCGEGDFPAFLRDLAARPRFFEVCETLAELGPERPFYPRRGQRGMTRAAHAAALGLGGPSGLSRACDRATAERPAGAPLFWTLGANQTGKAAISAWRDWLVPALAGDAPPLLWPFEGGLHALARPGAVVLAETYPAEAMRHLGLRLGGETGRGSKRRQADRAALAPALAGAMARLGAMVSGALAGMLADGFGADAAGEDRFDCVLGVLCVIGVVDGARVDFVPEDPWVRRWEGWVLGQSAAPIW